jgi:hypothetical protein
VEGFKVGDALRSEYGDLAVETVEIGPPGH